MIVGDKKIKYKCCMVLDVLKLVLINSKVINSNTYCQYMTD